jgi:hypothetical protein
MKKIFFILSICLISLFAVNCLAADVTLQWDENDPVPEGYRIFVCEGNPCTFDYLNPTWEGTGTTYTVTNLTEGTTYSFVARAYDDTLESGDSNIVVYTVEAPPETIVYPERPKQLIINFGN